MEKQDIEKRFSFHPVRSDADRVAHEEMRDKAKKLAEFINLMVPDSREKSLSITALEEALMWANAGIARNRE